MVSHFDGLVPSVVRLVVAAVAETREEAQFGVVLVEAAVVVAVAGPQPSASLAGQKLVAVSAPPSAAEEGEGFLVELGLGLLAAEVS